MTLDKGGRKEVVRAGYLIGAERRPQPHAPLDAGAPRRRDLRRALHRRGCEADSARFARAGAHYRGAERFRAACAASGRPVPHLRQSRRRRPERRRCLPPPISPRCSTPGSEPTSASPTCVGLRISTMHKRVVPALSDGRRFLLGDAGHLSSPMGGEGINSALMDGANIAWKLALVLRGAAKPSLLDSYAFERALADRHVLEVSNEIHCSGDAACRKMPRPGKRCPCLWMIQPRRSRACASARCSTYPTREAFSSSEALATPSPRPERAFPAGAISTGRRHHLVLSGGAPPLDDFRARWGGLVSVVEWTEADMLAKQAGLARGRRCSGPPGRLHRLPARLGG